MKNVLRTKFILFIMTIWLCAFSSSSQNQAERLEGTTWKIVLGGVQNTASERTMIFKQDHSFESRSENGTIFNQGTYSIINSETLVTVHEGAQSASLYNFTIKSDTLHLKGNYISSNFDSDNQKVDFEPIDELWVRGEAFKSNGVRFIETPTLEAALQQAAKEGKVLFMDCYTQWCGPCRCLASRIFPLKSVGEFYNTNFVNVSFDMETPEGMLIRKKYNIRAYPTLLFLNPAGEIQHMGVGAGDEKGMLLLGKTALDSMVSYKALKEKIAHGDRSAETIMGYLSVNNYATDWNKLIQEYFKNKSPKQRLSENSWNLFNSFDYSIEGDQFRFFVKHRADYEKMYGKDQVQNKIRKLFFNYMSDSLTHKSLEKVDPALFAQCKAQSAYREAFYWSRSDKRNAALWKKLLDASSGYFGLEGIDIKNDECKILCNFIYENYKTFDDKSALALAKDWAEKSCQQHPEDAEINDAYAHILFDLGFVEEAIHHEEIAIKKSLGSDVPSASRYARELVRFKYSKQ